MSTAVTLNISQEFFNAKGIMEYLPGFSDSIRKFLHDAQLRRDTPIPSLGVKPIVKEIQSVNYATARNWRVYVPAGMTSAYLDYLETLHKAVAITARLNDDVLRPFNLWLSMKLANPDTLQNLRDGKEIRDFRPHNLTGVSDELGKHFKRGSNVNQRPYGEVVRRHADLGEALEKTNALNNQFALVDRKKLLSMVEEITDKLDKLHARVEEDATVYEVSEVSLKTLAALCRTMAEEVEFYSMVGFQLKAVTVALEDTSEQLKKLAKQDRRR